MFVDRMNILKVLFYTFYLLWRRSYESKETIFTDFFAENGTRPYCAYRLTVAQRREAHKLLFLVCADIVTCAEVSSLALQWIQSLSRLPPEEIIRKSPNAIAVSPL